MTNLLTLDILFSTAVIAVIVPTLVILGILFLISFILALRAVVVTSKLGIPFWTAFMLALRVVLVVNLVKLGILFSIFLILALYTLF